LRVDWDKIGWVFITATVGEIVGCEVGNTLWVGIFIVMMIVDYATDIFWIENLGA
jgi:hypothetical protein